MPKIYDSKIIELFGREPDFDGFKWVLKATGKNSYLRCLNTIQIKKETVCATDGHRLHVFFPEINYPEGLYTPLINQKYKLILQKKDDNEDFPDWESVFPQHVNFQKLELLNGNISQNYTVLVRILPENITINYDYFADLGNDYFTTYIYEDNKMAFVSNNKLAMIMPMRA